MPLKLHSYLGLKEMQHQVKKALITDCIHCYPLKFIFTFTADMSIFNWLLMVTITSFMLKIYIYIFFLCIEANMPECTKSTAWILNENMHNGKFMKYSKRKEKEKKI